MKIKYILTNIIFCTYSIIQSQDLTDVVLAGHYFTIGDSLYTHAEYDRSITYFKKAVAVYKNVEDWGNYFKSKNKLSQNYRGLENYETSKTTAGKILKESVIKLGENNRAEARALWNMSYAYYHEKNYDLALESIKRGLLIIDSKFQENTIESGVYYNGLGQIYDKLHKSDSSLFFYQKAISVYEKNGVLESLDIADVYYNLGILHHKKRADKLSLEYHFKALSIRETNLQPDHPDIIKSYNTIATGYRSQAAYHSAMEYYLKVLKLRLERFGRNSLPVVKTYDAIAHANVGLAKYDNSLFYYWKALTILNIHFPKNYLQISKIYSGIAYTYMFPRKAGFEPKYDSALIFHKKSLKLREKYLPKDDQLIYYSYDQVGYTYYKLKKYNSAIYYFKKALPAVASNKSLGGHIYMSLGNCYFETGELHKALNFFHKSILIETNEHNDDVWYNPAASKIKKNGFQTRARIYYKAIAWEALYNKDKNPQNLKYALSAFQLCDTLIDKAKASFLKDEDKKGFGKHVNKILKNAVRISLELFEATGEEKFKSMSFYFAEKCKSGLLIESLNGHLAQKTKLLPSDIVKLEHSLKMDKAFYVSEINRLKARKYGYDTVRLKYQENLLFGINKKYDSLLVAIAEKYPLFYKVKYQNTPPAINHIQRKLSEQTALIEYFEENNTLYVFTITKDYYDVHTISIDSSYTQLMQDLSWVLKTQAQPSQPERVWQKYTSTARILYNNYLAPSLQKIPGKIRNLVIIPDGKLTYIPFEVLLTRKPDSKTINYNGLAYLIENYAISYGYSAQWYFRDLSLKTLPKRNTYLGYAPEYKPAIPGSAQLMAMGKFRDAVTSLEWNVNEVEETSNIMDGDHRLAKDATEADFKNQSTHYSVLHLAMHALVDDKDPMNSRLVFAKNENDSLEDGYLHTYELLSLNMNPELVVLSACNTGYGALERGEGLVSLAYGFAYAGCPSLVASHWQVDDWSTGQLMKRFYQNLADGMDKSTALQQAKLQFLKNAGPIYSNPFYWGGFILIGDPAPVKLKSSSSSWTYMLLVFFAVAIGVVMLVKRSGKITLHYLSPQG